MNSGLFSQDSGLLTLQSPAKINLFLRILGKRSDGYHELASLFQAIDLCDTIEMCFANHDRFTCTDPNLPLDSSNLVQKAIQLFRKKTGLSAPLQVHLIKRIPKEAGLGGGSSNAATILWGLNQLQGNPASLQELISWASEVGSDVPFFLSEGTAYCTGRGEKIRFLPPLPEQTLWIVKPPRGLATKQIYETLQVRQLENRDPEKILKGFLAGNYGYINDLEIPAFSLWPGLSQIKQRLKDAGFDQVIMTGSGSALYCIGPGKVSLESFPEFFLQKVSFCNRSSGYWYGLPKSP